MLVSGRHFFGDENFGTLVRFIFRGEWSGGPPGRVLKGGTCASSVPVMIVGWMATLRAVRHAQDGTRNDSAGSVEAEVGLHAFEGLTFGFGVDEEDGEELDDHHEGEEGEG